MLEYCKVISSVEIQMKEYNENTIGENIRNLRMQKEMKQTALALGLNFGRQSISAYERGVTLPDIYSLIRIVLILMYHG